MVIRPPRCGEWDRCLWSRSAEPISAVRLELSNGPFLVGKVHDVVGLYLNPQTPAENLQSEVFSLSPNHAERS